MCASCGCRTVHDNQGDPRHITLDDIDRAADAANLSRQDVVNNIAQAVGREMMQGLQSSTSPGTGPMHSS